MAQLAPRLAAVLVAAALAGAASAQPSDDPKATFPAVAALFAASGMRIDGASTCHGQLPGIARPTLGDLLASRLAYLGAGANRVEGGCKPGSAPACRVVVTHADGEDVASAEFRFRKRGGRLDPSSLTCILTP